MVSRNTKTVPIQINKTFSGYILQIISTLDHNDLQYYFFVHNWSKNSGGVKGGHCTKKLQEIHDATCWIHYVPMKKLSSYDHQSILIIILLLVRKLESCRDPLQVTKPLIWYCFCKKERQRVNSRQRRKTSNSENSK